MRCASSTSSSAIEKADREASVLFVHDREAHEVQVARLRNQPKTGLRRPMQSMNMSPSSASNSPPRLTSIARTRVSPPSRASEMPVTLAPCSTRTLGKRRTSRCNTYSNVARRPHSCVRSSSPASGS
jgi:hypothetical protein